MTFATQSKMAPEDVESATANGRSVYGFASCHIAFAKLERKLGHGFGFWLVLAFHYFDWRPAWAADGGMAFFNDLTRELLAFILIPLVIHRHTALAIGYSGATPMACSLFNSTSVTPVFLSPWSVGLSFRYSPRC